MDFGIYVTERMVAARLDELRAEGRRRALLRTARAPGSRVGTGLGIALIRIGRWLAPGDPGAARNGGVRLAR
jgi:hypothetical protein